MKGNRIDELFRKKLVGYGTEPSPQALESLRIKLGRRRKAISMRRWAIAATITLLGAGAIWMGSVMIHWGSSAYPERDIAGVRPGDFQIGSKGQVHFEGEDIPGQPEKAGGSPASQTEKEKTISDAGTADVAVNTTHDNAGRVERVRGSRAAKMASIETVVHKEAETIPREAPENYNEQAPDTAVAMAGRDDPAKVANDVRKVPIKIVYKRTEPGEFERGKRKGIIKKGIGKITAAIDRLNLRDGAKSKLQKTRDDLVALNPVNMFKKEEN